MIGSLILAALLSLTTRAAAAQPASVLHIKIVLLDAEQKANPVPHHALLISDNPASALPRRTPREDPFHRCRVARESARPEAASPTSRSEPATTRC